MQEQLEGTLVSPWKGNLIEQRPRTRSFATDGEGRTTTVPSNCTMVSQGEGEPHPSSTRPCWPIL